MHIMKNKLISQQLNLFEKFDFVKENLGPAPATARRNPFILFVNSMDLSFKSLLYCRFN